MAGIETIQVSEGRIVGADTAQPIDTTMFSPSGGVVTQLTNRSTGVTLSKVSGQITTDTTSLAAGASASFTVTNTAVKANDVIVLNITGATNKATRALITAVAAGSFEITITNNHATVAEVAASTIQFVVLRGAIG